MPFSAADTDTTRLLNPLDVRTKVAAAIDTKGGLWMGLGVD
jgi:hypothetical protein